MIKNFILQFLEDQFQKKSESDRKKLEKATSSSEIETLNQSINDLKQKYQFDSWIADAANRMAKQLSFSTHLSKGIHPDSKGDNINFSFSQPLSDEFVGSQVIPTLTLDASGNAAALPLAAFFNIVIDEDKNLRLRDLLLQDAPELQGAFHNDLNISEQYKQQFQAALKGELEQPATHERNKQLLWANGEKARENGDYTCIIPLYPSALTNLVYQKIQTIRYGEENKQSKADGLHYTTISNLAFTKLGGTKPQNISQLNSMQGGKHYLLPSVPPKFSSPHNLLSLTTTTLFNKELYHYCYPFFKELFDVVLAEKNVYPERDMRKDAVDMLAEIIIGLAQNIQQDRSAGWSKDYPNLKMSEKYWLDPQRAELEGEQAFQDELLSRRWEEDIFDSFGHWVNEYFKYRFNTISKEFSVSEFYTWRKQFERKFNLNK